MKGLSLWETGSWVSGQDIEESTQQICKFVFPTKLVMLVQFVLYIMIFQCKHEHSVCSKAYNLVTET